MRKIVVPVSFSANSANAVRYAADMALAIGGEVHLVHVLREASHFSKRPMPHFLFEEFRDGGYQLLNHLAEEVRRRTAGKAPVSIDLQIGDGADRLREYCERCRPFLVVMGGGEASIEEGFESSPIIRAMQRLPYPLLLIPANAIFHGVGKVVLACDTEDIYSGVSSVLPFLNDLSRLLGARFEVVYVVADGESVGDVAKEYDGWKKELATFEAQLHVVRRDKVGDGITYYLEHHPADWLLVLPKKHSMLGFHKSRAKEIVLHCAVPVMSLHE